MDILKPTVNLTDRDIEYSQLVLIAAKWEAALALLNREEVSDFMLSFPEVQQLADAIKKAGDY